MKAKLIAIVIGLIVLGFGIYMITNGNRLEKVCTDPVRATVVDVLWQTEIADEDEMVDTYTATIEYNYKAHKYKHTLAKVYNENEYKEKDKVDILVNPKKPTEFIIKGKGKATLPAILFIVIGSVVVVFSIFGKVKVTSNV